MQNNESDVPIWWDDNRIYGFVVEPTEIQKNLIHAINKLSHICRKVMILYAFERIHRAEIAATMKRSLGAICELIHRSGLLPHEYLANKEKQDLLVRQNAVESTLSDWPYMEYAQLVEL